MAFIGEVNRISSWLGSFLVSQSQSRVVTYAAEGQVRASSGYLARQTRYMATAEATETDPVPSTSRGTDLRGVSSSSSNSSSSSSHLSALRYLRGGGGKPTPSPSPTPPQPPPEQVEEEEEGSTLTWSPLPKRNEKMKVTEKLCVALLCGGREGAEGGSGEKGALENPTHPRPVTPNPPQPHNTTPKPQVRRKWPYCTLAIEPPRSPSLSPPLSPTPHLLRPCTNPRDTPTHHPNPTHPLLPPAPARDLTLESLHDLEWLSEMDPSEQAVLEVHVIWSILSLMVVLLACYSLHHHPPLTG
ncbi:bromodomain-containing protein 4B-like [Portunus trituberculatus]|uniref:bromodomain-containing protein 4B-like n=1 Tax=Portunus trituberculatus TaxID=210409 RepID=UPI001E1CB64F|nr:bromodomain-containing protein 4B-like [Portunus trituberculatus]